MASSWSDLPDMVGSPAACSPAVKALHDKRISKETAIFEV